MRIASLYVPNGREVGHDQYHYKLEWLGRLRAHLDAQHDPAMPLALLGDFNIAPRDIDVWDRKAFEGATHVTEPERTALDEVFTEVKAVEVPFHNALIDEDVTDWLFLARGLRAE